jgi:hypothetical protein
MNDNDCRITMIAEVDSKIDAIYDKPLDFWEFQARSYLIYVTIKPCYLVMFISFSYSEYGNSLELRTERVREELARRVSYVFMSI